jgi:hypothetical protein
MLTTIPDDHRIGFPSSMVDTMELLEPLMHDSDVPAMRPVPHGGCSALEAVAERWLLLRSTHETREALEATRARFPTSPGSVRFPHFSKHPAR